MNIKPVLIIIVILIVSAFVFMKNTKLPETPLNDVKTVDERNVYLGAWAGNFWDNDTRTLNTMELKNFENNIQKKVAIANIFTDWKYISNNEYLNVLNQISQNGWAPMISSNPSFFEKCEERDKSLYKTIADGNCDDHIKEIANNFKSFDKPLFFRFAWEMNLPDMYWSIASLNSTPEEFVNAWRRLHSVMRAEGATNVIWVLSFNTSSSKTVPYQQLYPGDSYVDWVAIDGYNWGTSQDWSGWTSFNGVFKNSYNELVSVSKKPIMLSEVNSSPDGGDKSEWLVDMLAVQIPFNYPNVEAIVFFNENKSEGESVDWRMELSQDYLQALQNNLNREIYKSNFPFSAN